MLQKGNDNLKQCRECNNIVALEYFFKQKDGKYGRQGSCKLCINKRRGPSRAEYYLKNREKILQRMAEYQKNNADKIKEKDRWKHLKRTYGLTKEAYESRHKAQNGKCAICAIKDIKVVDHDHKTNKVRGLLCFGCNRDLAILDNPKLLLAARKYKDESN